MVVFSQFEFLNKRRLKNYENWSHIVRRNVGKSEQLASNIFLEIYEDCLLKVSFLSGKHQLKVNEVHEANILDSKLKTMMRRHSHQFDAFIVNFGHV